MKVIELSNWQWHLQVSAVSPWFIFQNGIESGDSCVGTVCCYGISGYIVDCHMCLENTL